MIAGSTYCGPLTAIDGSKALRVSTHTRPRRSTHPFQRGLAGPTQALHTQVVVLRP
jgi:hypothetical protein